MASKSLVTLTSLGNTVEKSNLKANNKLTGKKIPAQFGSIVNGYNFNLTI